MILAGRGSGWGCGADAELVRCREHAVVVRDDEGELGAEAARRGEVYGVESSQLDWLEGGGV